MIGSMLQPGPGQARPYAYGSRAVAATMTRKRLATESLCAGFLLPDSIFYSLVLDSLYSISVEYSILCGSEVASIW
jgi:hypothetical protein